MSPPVPHNRLAMKSKSGFLGITRLFNRGEVPNGGFIFLSIILGSILSVLITQNLTLGVAFLVGLSILVLFCIYPLLGLYLVLALSVWVQLLFPQDPQAFGITGVKLIGWVAFGGWFYNIFITRKIRINPTGLGGVVITIILLGIFSAGWARELPFLWRKVFTFIQLGALLYMITSLVTDEKKLWGVFLVLSVAIWASNLASLFQYLSDPRIRAMGFDRDPNYASAVTIVGIFFTAFLLSRARSTAFKILLAVMLFVMISGVILTLSRAGMISLGVATVAWILKRKNKGRAIIGIACVVALIFLLAPHKFYLRVVRPKTYAESASIANRMLELRTGLNMIAHNPLLGVGLGNFEYNYLRYVHYHQQRAAHNTYVNIAAEQGLPGLAIFLWLFIKVWLNFRKVQKKSSSSAGLLYQAAFFAEIAFIGYLFNAAFIDTKFEKVPWILMGISSALVFIQARNDNSTHYEKSTG